MRDAVVKNGVGKPQLILREATSSDARGIAECWYNAFSGSHLNEWILPASANHTTYLDHFTRTMRSSILKHDSKVIVVIASPETSTTSATPATTTQLQLDEARDRGRGRVAGYATYKEIRHGHPAMHPTLPQRALYLLDHLRNTLLALLDRIRGRGHELIDRRFDMIGHQQDVVFAGTQNHPGVPHYYYITWLAVHPDFEGLGVCSKLLNYGIASGLPLYLEASDEGYPIYSHKGFRDLTPTLDILREDGSLVESLPTMLYPGKSTAQ